MKYWRLLHSLLLISTIAIVDGSVVKAKANSGNKSDRILQILHQVKNQRLDLTFKDNYVCNQNPSLTPVCENSSPTTPEQERESKPKQCPIVTNLIANLNQKTVGNITITGSTVLSQRILKQQRIS